MYSIYMKQLIQDGGGAFHHILLEAETEEGAGLKRDHYIANGWHESTKEEHDAQLAEVAARHAGEPEFGGQPAEEPQAEASVEAPAEPVSEVPAEEAPVEEAIVEPVAEAEPAPSQESVQENA